MDGLKGHLRHYDNRPVVEFKAAIPAHINQRWSISDKQCMSSGGLKMKIHSNQMSENVPNLVTNHGCRVSWKTVQIIGRA